MLEITAQKEKTNLFNTLVNRIYQVKCAHSGHKFHPSRDTTGIYTKLKIFIRLAHEFNIKLKNKKFLDKIVAAGDKSIAGGGGASAAAAAAPADEEDRIWRIWVNLTIEEIKHFMMQWDEDLIRDWYYQIPMHNRPVPYKWMYLFGTAETKCLLEPYKNIVDYYSPSDIGIQMVMDL